MSEEEENYLKFKELIGAQGSYTEGKKLYIDLSHQRYEAVKLVGDFVNDLDNGLLILRKDEENYLAFDNCCPTLGVETCGPLAITNLNVATTVIVLVLEEALQPFVVPIAGLAT